MALINTTTTGVLGSTFYADGSGDLTIQQNGALVNKITSTGFTVHRPGTVLQVVQGIFTSVFSSTSSAYVTTGITATITPSSATSKILIFVSTTAGISSHTDSYYFSIFRDSTNLSYATGYTIPAMARQYQASPSTTASDGFQMNLSYLDSPTTTSATTYTLRIRNDGSSSTMYIGRIVSSADPHGGVIQLMEIAG